MKPLRTTLILTGLSVVVSLGIVAYLMFWGPDRLQLSGKSLSEMLESGDILALIIIPLVLVISGVALLPFLRMIFPDEIKNGISAQARVLKVWDTGVSINDNPQVGLLLEVLPPGGSPFQAEAKTVVSRLNTALVQPGTMAEVKYDPQKPQHLQISTLHVQSTASSDAATRLEQVETLRNKGLISEEEYRRKREEILKTL